MARAAADLIAEHKAGTPKEVSAYIAKLEAENDRLRKLKTPKVTPIKFRKGKAPKHICRVIVPDSHGAHIDPQARDAFLGDLSTLQPTEIVMLGDHLDCGGTFSNHQATYSDEVPESYDDDLNATNDFLDAIQRCAPNAQIHYLEGNHEQHVERWACKMFRHRTDIDRFLKKFGPYGELRLAERDIKYYRRGQFHDGLSINGTIRRGRCFFTHGVSHSKHADSTHLERFGASVVFGHVHRSISTVSRTVTSVGHGAWCPGTLAKLQMLYKHTHPSTHTHGYAVQFVNQSSENFSHVNVAIVGGQSTLAEMVAALRTG